MQFALKEEGYDPENRAVTYALLDSSTREAVSNDGGMTFTMGAAHADVDGDGDDDIAMAYQNGDGTSGLHVFRHGVTWSGIWYTGGQYNLDRVTGRLVLRA